MPLSLRRSPGDGGDAVVRCDFPPLVVRLCEQLGVLLTEEALADLVAGSPVSWTSVTLVPKQITPCFIEAVPLPTEAQKTAWFSKSRTVEFSTVYEGRDTWQKTAWGADWHGSEYLAKLSVEREAQMARLAKHGDRKQRQKWEPPAPLGGLP